MSNPLWYTTSMKNMKHNSKVLMRENILAEAVEQDTLRDAQVWMRMRLHQENMGTTESDYALLERAWEANELQPGFMCWGNRKN